MTVTYQKDVSHVFERVVREVDAQYAFVGHLSFLRELEYLKELRPHSQNGLVTFEAAER